MAASQPSDSDVVDVRAPPSPRTRVLVAEDEWLTARELEATLLEAGYQVVGPAPSVEAAMRILAVQGLPDVALLDVNLRGQLVTPVAEALAARGIPFLLVTAYAERDLNDRVLTDAPRLAKPAGKEALLEWLCQAVHATAVASARTSPG